MLLNQSEGSVLSAIAVYANCIFSIDGSVLVVTVGFLPSGPDSKIHATIRKLHYMINMKSRSHTRDDIIEVLNCVLPEIVQDFPLAELFLVRDGCGVNFSGEFFKGFKDFQSIYCLLHVLAVRTSAILCHKAKSTYAFLDNTNREIPIVATLGRQFCDLPLHLLKANLGTKQVVTVLSLMCRSERNQQIWKCLYSEPEDSDHPLKRALFLTAALYDSTLKGHKTGDSTLLLSQYVEHLTTDFKYTPRQGADPIRSWGQSSQDSFVALRATRNNLPLQFFTLSMDEHIKSSALKFSNGMFHPSLPDRPISFDSVKGTVELLYKQQAVLAHSNYGEFANEVMFLK